MSQAKVAIVPVPAGAGHVASLPPKPKKSILPLFALVVGVVNLGGTGFLAQRLMQPLKVEAAPVEKAPEKPEPPPTIAGPTLSLDPFVVNLNEPNSTRYLKVVLELEAVDAKALERLTLGKPLLRDEFLRYLSSLSVVETQGEVAKQKIQGELKSRLDKSFGEETVHRLFFAEFVVQ